MRAAKGKVRLVKINIDENPGVAGQLGVRSIPAVYAFDKGRPVDGFMGAMPESQIKLFVDASPATTLSADIEALLEQASESLDARRHRRRRARLRRRAAARSRKHQSDRRHGARLSGRRRCRTSARGSAHGARRRKPTIPTSPACAPRLNLPPTPQARPAMPALWRTRSPANPQDLQARFDLADALAARGDLEGASRSAARPSSKPRPRLERGRRAQAIAENLRSRRPRLRDRQERAPQAVGAFVLMSAFGYRKPADLPQTIPLFPLAGRDPVSARRAAAQHVRAALSQHGRRRARGRSPDRHDPARARGEERRQPSTDLAEVGTVGRITAFSETDDGRYLITLTGICRFRVAPRDQGRHALSPSRRHLRRFRRRSLRAARRGIDRERCATRSKRYVDMPRLSDRLVRGRQRAAGNAGQRRRAALPVRPAGQAGAAGSALARRTLRCADRAARMGRADGDAMRLLQ